MSLSNERLSGGDDAQQADALSVAPHAAAVLPPSALHGSRVYFGGDSITNGSAASAARAYIDLVQRSLGSLVMRPDFVEAGVPGQTAEQLLARVGTEVATHQCRYAHITIGTNDAGQGVQPSTYINHVKAIMRHFMTQGIRFVWSTVIPHTADAALPNRGGVTHNAQRLGYLHAYNTALRVLVPQFGGILCDLYTALADPATGYADRQYFTADDGLHPSDAGHVRMAVEVLNALEQLMVRQVQGRPFTHLSPLTAGMPAGAGLISKDPVNRRDSVKSAGWFEQPGGTGALPSYSMVADSTGDLHAGRWMQIAFNTMGTSGLSTRSLVQFVPREDGFKPGDVLSTTAVIQVEDSSGTWLSDLATTSVLEVKILNQSAVPVFAPVLLRAPGVRAHHPVSGKPVYTLMVYSTYTVPDGASALAAWFTFAVPAARHYLFRIGQVGTINHSAIGVTAGLGALSNPLLVRAAPIHP